MKHPPTPSPKKKPTLKPCPHGRMQTCCTCGRPSITHLPGKHPMCEFYRAAARRAAGGKR